MMLLVTEVQDRLGSFRPVRSLLRQHQLHKAFSSLGGIASIRHSMEGMGKHIIRL